MLPRERELWFALAVRNRSKYMGFVGVPVPEIELSYKLVWFCTRVDCTFLVLADVSGVNP